MDLSDPLSAIEFFPGGVPPAPLVQMHIEDLMEVVRDQTSQRYAKEVAALATIGLVAYFEAFSKDLFASMVNIDPSLLEELRKHQFDTTIDSSNLLLLESASIHQFGPLLAEKASMGTPKEINRAFYCALQVTMLNRGDVRFLDHLLLDRHLLVHHGGLITARYHRTLLKRRSVSARLHFDSIVVEGEVFLSHARRLLSIAEQMSNTSATALRKRAKQEGSNLASPAQERAVSYLDWWNADPKDPNAPELGTEHN